jgi:hypothetical protein
VLHELHGSVIFGGVDWQEPAALLVVAITVGVFVAARRRRQRAASGCAGGCGCATARPPSESPEPIRFTQRKSDRPADTG